MTPEEARKFLNAPAGILDNVEHYHPEFIHDESQLVGWMDSISFPAGERDIRDQLALMNTKKTPVTVQGARTGLAGGAVPQGGHTINLNRMMKITGLRREGEAFFLICQPGVLMREHIWPAANAKEFETDGWSDESLRALEEFTAAGAYLFTPDPSEPTVTIGGMVACNASGARSFLYGPTRPHVERLRVVLIDGDILDLKRGRERADGRTFRLETEGGRVIEGVLPTYEMPHVKNAAGYFAADDMDLIDLFIGSEGTLGVISEVEVRLVRAPAEMTGVMAFLPDEPAALHLAKDLKASHARPAAIEYFDRASVEMLRANRSVFGPCQMGNEIPPGELTALYLEYHGETDWIDRAIGELRERLGDRGGDAGSIWVGRGHEAVGNFKQIKHMLPELVNGRVAERAKSAPGIRKLGSDLAVPDERLDELMALHHADLAAGGYDYLIFGHLGDNNLHVNVIARDLTEYEAGREMYRRWARAAVEMGGTVSAEHGIGKIKTALLAEMFSPADLAQMADLKRLFDPDGLLSPGNILPP